METVLIKVLQLILSLSILVFVHELGHFGFARLFKVRVDKFYLFFNPRFSIFRCKKVKGKWQFRWFAPNLPDHLQPLLDENGMEKKDKKGNTIYVPAPLDELDDDDWRKYPETTEWGIGWVPLGGYCKIAGMIDESMDPSVIHSEPQPWEYRSQKAWKRLFIITGGVLMNFITAIVIYAMMLFTWGQEYLPLQNAYLGYDYCQTALDYGFRNGDIILSVDGEPVETEQDAMQTIVIEGGEEIEVLRGGKRLLLTIPKDFGESMLKAEETMLMSPRFPFVVNEVAPGTPAEAAGLEKGDSVVGINGKSLAAYSDIVKELAQCASKPIGVEFYRGDSLHSVEVTLKEDAKLGVMIADPMQYFKTKRLEYGFFSSIPAGIKLGWETLANYVKQFRLVFTEAGAKSVGGFIAIGNIFPGMWDWATFWSMTALLSVMLAFMNILPIPILDGGYVLFLLYEMITGRKPSDRFMEVSLNIGMLLLLALLIFANGNDILKLFR